MRCTFRVRILRTADTESNIRKKKKRKTGDVFGGPWPTYSHVLYYIYV